MTIADISLRPAHILPPGVVTAQDLMQSYKDTRQRLRGVAMKTKPAPAPKTSRDWLLVEKPQKQPPPSALEVLVVVCNRFDIPSWQVASPNRGDRATSRVRHVAMYLALKLTDETPAQIAELFRRDRSTVAQAAKALKETLEAEPDLVATVEELWEQLDRSQP